MRETKRQKAARPRICNLLCKVSLIGLFYLYKTLEHHFSRSSCTMNHLLILKIDATMANKLLQVFFVGYAVFALLGCKDYGYCGSGGNARLKPDALFSQYSRLLQDPNATREDWLKVIAGLLKIHERQHRDQAPRALLFAGRGAIVLYEKSQKKEDLDKALRLLNILVRQYEKSSYFIDGLKELKRAHETKLRLLQKASLSHSVSRPQKAGNVETNIMPQPSGRVQGTTALIGDSVAQKDAKDPLDADQQSRRSGVVFQATRVGNPYYDTASQGPQEDQARKYGAVSDQLAVPEHRREKTQVPEKKCRPFVIVLDPGHGGRDPGAVSPDGSMKEKDFTLDLCFRIQKRLLNVLPDAHVKLTRNADTYLALVDRAEIANSLDGDLFLSIHGNAYADSRAAGVETFYLSAANSRGAMRVAARENGISLAKMTDLQATLVDLVVTGKKEESALLAQEVHSSLLATMKERGHSARDRGVKTAPFYVLLGAKMPAILVECLFLTNFKDRKNLLVERKLNDIADGVVKGIVKYVLLSRDQTGSPSLTTSLKSRSSS